MDGEIVTTLPEEGHAEFRERREHGGHVIEYTDLFEAFQQGGPTLGHVRVDGKKVSLLSHFGGPMLCDGQFAYAPVLTGREFQIARIDLEARKFVRVSGKHRMIWLEKLQGNRLYFWTHVSQKEGAWVEV